MTYTTISIKDKTKKELKNLLSIYNAKSMDELLKILIIEAKKKKIDDFGFEFQKKLNDKNLSLEDIIKSGEDIRAKILKEESKK
ncbi:MAG: hypothetical protein MUP85_09255 [Candidatus Lokiarchaeota archaeon]|nr:hypothetical protein [Candidatus Lokiarchaeota archaeon]